MADIPIGSIPTGTVDTGDDILGVARPAGTAALFSTTSIIALAQTFASPLLAPDGTAAAPGYAFTNDTDMGFYRGADNRLALAVSGAEYWITGAGNGGGFQVQDNITSIISGQVSGQFGATNEPTINRLYFHKDDNAEIKVQFRTDDGTKTGLTVVTSATVSNAGSKLLRLVNNATEVFTITPLGGIKVYEQADIAAPAANSVVLYARDNGGKTELVARFATGAIQQLAIEP